MRTRSHEYMCHLNLALECKAHESEVKDGTEHKINKHNNTKESSIVYKHNPLFRLSARS